MRICLTTLVLNEMQWLPKLYRQHKNWPHLAKWIFVESADSIYAKTNPDLVNGSGLSVDGTTEFLEELAKNDERIVHIKHGFSTHGDPAQGKCQSRDRYLREMDLVSPNFYIVVDADEFYLEKHQEEILRLISKKSSRYTTGFCFKHRDIWHPESINNHPLFKYEVTGGFWNIPYCRVWRWFAGMQHRNHNTPSKSDGIPLDKRMRRFDQQEPSLPYFVHMGFASDLKFRKAKNRYYENRGEFTDKKRSWYCDSRACFENWQPGDTLPNSAYVIPYTGEIPECFR